MNVSDDAVHGMPGSFLRQWYEADDSRRRVLLTDYIRLQLASFLNLEEPALIPLRRSLIDLGIDSLRAVDFKTVLEKDLRCSLRSSLLFDYPTLEGLVTYLKDEVFASDTSMQCQEKFIGSDPPELLLRDSVSSMSDQQIAQMLAEQIRTMSNKRTE